MQGIEIRSIGEEGMSKRPSGQFDHRILTVEEVAEHVRVSPDEIEAELQSGRLQGFRVGNNWRIRSDALEDFLRPKSPQTRQALDSPQITFSKGVPFTHIWPSKKGQEDSGPMDFDSTYDGVANFKGHIRSIRIGFTTSSKPGKRGKAVVFVDGRPMVIFRAADNRQSGLMVSIIKTDDRKQLRAGAPIPSEYSSFQIEPFRMHIAEKHSSTNLAVVCKKGDLQTMADHALIRASQIEARKEGGKHGR
jgi:excisionase family DNA binding protein